MRVSDYSSLRHLDAAKVLSQKSNQRENQMPTVTEMQQKAKELGISTATNYEICFQLVLMERQIEVIRERLAVLEPKSVSA